MQKLTVDRDILYDAWCYDHKVVINISSCLWSRLSESML